MKTLYKESNTEEKFNNIRIKHDHPKNTTPIFIGENNQAHLRVTLVEFVFATCLTHIVFKAVHWSCMYGKI